MPASFINIRTQNAFLNYEHQLHFQKAKEYGKTSNSTAVATVIKHTVIWESSINVIDNIPKASCLS